MIIRFTLFGSVDQDSNQSNSGGRVSAQDSFGLVAHERQQENRPLLLNVGYASGERVSHLRLPFPPQVCHENSGPLIRLIKTVNQTVKLIQQRYTVSRISDLQQDELPRNQAEEKCSYSFVVHLE